MDIDEIAARLEIQDVLCTYARGVDRGDHDALASVYHEGATDHHCNFSGPAAEFVQGLVDRAKHDPIVGQHHITNTKIAMDGRDDARVESYFLAFRPHVEAGEKWLAVAGGRYLDHFQRRDGAWKIRARQVVMDWTRDEQGLEPWASVDARPVQGSRKWEGDPSYRFFADPTR